MNANRLSRRSGSVCEARLSRRSFLTLVSRDESWSLFALICVRSRLIFCLGPHSFRNRFPCRHYRKATSGHPFDDATRLESLISSLLGGVTYARQVLECRISVGPYCARPTPGPLACMLAVAAWREVRSRIAKGYKGGRNRTSVGWDWQAVDMPSKSVLERNGSRRTRADQAVGPTVLVLNANC
jgi:hypothetical protein